MKNTTTTPGTVQLAATSTKWDHLKGKEVQITTREGVVFKGTLMDAYCWHHDDPVFYLEMKRYRIYNEVTIQLIDKSFTIIELTDGSTDAF